MIAKKKIYKLLLCVHAGKCHTVCVCVWQGRYQRTILGSLAFCFVVFCHSIAYPDELACKLTGDSSVLTSHLSRGVRWNYRCVLLHLVLHMGPRNQIQTLSHFCTESFPRGSSVPKILIVLIILSISTVLYTYQLALFLKL